MGVFEILQERGFIKQTTHPGIQDLLNHEKISFYIGFDPTADSLHVGHFIPLVVMMHLQKAGHRPIALVGGATAMIGDPSGRTDMRRMLTKDDIARNVAALQSQMSKYLDFSEDKAVMVNNAAWLGNVNYIDFLRDIGASFSVNRMLTAECFKSRLEKGLSFLEFNYMLMQAYDFLHLYKTQGCRLQVGGDDQWSNILAGADLVRRKEQAEVYGLTLSLLLNSQGQKMGKTAGGALWLDAAKTSPYDFYQYWRNVEDGDVGNCLAMLTFLPMDEVRRLSALKDEKINEAKEILAYEVTALIHGKDEAEKAQTAARALFVGGTEDSNMPTTTLSPQAFKENKGILDLLVKTELAKSKGDARRLVEGGGIMAGDEKVSSFDYTVNLDDQGMVILRKGKKVFHRVAVK